ncbi:hypothetical protein [Lysobacter sp. FW306-1B-D06B]|uniref:hypothetical protein n=1 Tax=Lysobacter sp. FW306-1B-D06B TaxID=3140250 RepID=UPI003140565A
MFVFAMAGLLPLRSEASDRTSDIARIEASGRRFDEVQRAAVPDYLDGHPDRALARFDKAIDKADWRSYFTAGNLLFSLHPDASYRWHTQAYELSKGDDLVRLELALHYTRREECPKALEAWTALERSDLVTGYMPMLAGYCYLKLGDDKRAFAMFDSVKGRLHGRFEDVLEQLWGERPALRAHADRLLAFRTSGSLADLDGGLENAIRFGIGQDRGKALAALAQAAAPSSPQAPAVFGQLACLRPAFEAEASASEASGDPDASVKAEWKQRMETCGLALGRYPLPDDAALARLLVVTAINLDIASAQELLAAHAASLAGRAQSDAGDIGALRLLAAMQARVSDPGLKETDELGWTRYGDVRFAASRLAGRLVGNPAPTAEDLAQLDRARRQFPQDQAILGLWLRYSSPDKEAARAAWRELALMEFHSPRVERDPIHMERTAVGLYFALRGYREAAGL